MIKHAGFMTDDEIIAELAVVEARIANGFGDHAGSPGEWWYERADELIWEQERRAARDAGGGE